MMVDIEKADGAGEEQDDVPPERAAQPAAVEENKDVATSNNNSKRRTLVLLVLACAIILTAVLVPLLLPDDEKELEEPSVKPTINPDLPTSNGTDAVLYTIKFRLTVLAYLTLSFPLCIQSFPYSNRKCH
eukprot:scaffold2321_cov124-Cylindrotheca_fusiformis.AAC.2